MLSPSDERYSLAPKDSRGAGNATTKDYLGSARTRYRPPSNPPSHPAATAEVGQLLDLGLALGHQRFELVSLAGRDDGGMVAAHAWAEVRDSSGVDPRAMPAPRARSRRRPPPPPPASDDEDVRIEPGHHQDALREVTSAHVGLVLAQARVRASALLCYPVRADVLGFQTPE